MAQEKCFEEVRKIASPDFSSQELRDLIKRLDTKRKTAAIRGANVRDELEKLSNEVASRSELLSKGAALRRIKRAELLHAATQQVLGFVGRKKGFFEGIKSWQTGTETGLAGSRGSLDLDILTFVNGTFGKLEREISKENLTPYFVSREYEEEFAKSLANIDTPIEAVNKAGKLFRDTMDFLDKKLEENGIFVPKLKFRVTRSYHDPLKLLRTDDNILKHMANRVRLKGDQKALFELAFKRWLDFVYPSSTNSMYDGGLTFGAIIKEDDRIIFLREAFRSLTNKGNPYKITPDIVSRLSQPKVLHPKDAAAVVRYNKKYGKGTIQDAILAEIQSLSHTVALVEKVGTNPKKFLEDLMKAVEKVPQFKFRAGIEKDKVKLRAIMDELDGTMYSPGSAFSNVMKNIRSIQNLKVVATLVFRSLPDLNVATAELNRFNQDMGKSIAEPIVSLFKTFNTTAERKQFLDAWNVNANSQLGGFTRWFAAADSRPGAMTRAMRVANKIGMIEHWDYGIRSGIASNIARFLAVIKNKSFKGLPEEAKKIFSWYQIDEDDWNLIRKFPVKTVDGHEVIVPESINSIPDEDVKEILRKQGFKKVSKRKIEDHKKDLLFKLHTFVQDRMDHAIIRPDAADKASLRFFGKPGTVSFEAALMLAHFKHYILAYTRRVLGNAIYGKGAETFLEAFSGDGAWYRGKADYQMLIQLITYGTILGYAQETMFNLASGVSPPNPADPKVWAESLIRGSGPIYMDMMLSNFHGRGESIARRALGPDISFLSDLAAITQSWIRGEGSALQAVRFTKRAVPQPFYFKFAADYLIWNRLEELAHPGTYRKKMRRLKKEGLNYLIPPP